MSEVFAVYNKTKARATWAERLWNRTPTRGLSDTVRQIRDFQASGHNISIRVTESRLEVLDGQPNPIILDNSIHLARTLQRTGLAELPVPKDIDPQVLLETLMTRSMQANTSFLLSTGVSDVRIVENETNVGAALSFKQVQKAFIGSGYSSKHVFSAYEALNEFLASPNKQTANNALKYLRTITTSIARIGALESFIIGLTENHLDLLDSNAIRILHFSNVPIDSLSRDDLMGLLHKSFFQSPAVGATFSHENGAWNHLDNLLAEKRFKAYEKIKSSLTSGEIGLIVSNNRDEDILLDVIDHPEITTGALLFACGNYHSSVAIKAFEKISKSLTTNDITSLEGKVCSTVIEQLIKHPKTSNSVLLFYALRKYLGAFERLFDRLSVNQIRDISQRYWGDSPIEVAIRDRLIVHPKTSARIIAACLSQNYRILSDSGQIIRHTEVDADKAFLTIKSRQRLVVEGIIAEMSHFDPDLAEKLNRRLST